MLPESKAATKCSVATPAGNPNYFYHSFPRIPRQKDYALGLTFLDSILEKGLLRTAELRSFPACKDLDALDCIQQRVCFTALTIDQLPCHAETFGSFSLEFDGTELRDFGALPAVYFSGRLPDGEIFNRAGEMLARRLLEAHNDLGRLWHLHDNGVEEEKKLAKALLAKIHPSKITVQELHFALRALLNLYYPTDDANRTAPLHYYQQREWKIVPNFASEGKWHHPEPSPEEALKLLQINPDFFGAIMQGGRRVDHCLYFRDVNGKAVLSSARRIIIPDTMVDDAKKIVAARGHNFEVIPESTIK